MAINPSTKITSHNKFVKSQTSHPIPFSSDTMRRNVASREFNGDVGEGEELSLVSVGM